MKLFQSASGSTYYTQEKPFAKGGEGQIYDVINYYDRVVKIYTNDKRTEHQERKLKQMLTVKLDSNVAKQFAWPIDIIYDNGEFVGFAMNKIKGVALNRINSDEYKDMPLSKKITIAKNLCAAVDSLHQTGNVIGDLNPNNVLVETGSGFVRLIDCDSFHISASKNRVYRCEVAMPDYLAPSVSRELAGGESLKTAHLPTFTIESDLFSLGIHIFQLLMQGTHPFAMAVKNTSQKSVTLPQPSENMKKGVFTYYNCPSGFKPPLYALPFKMLPENLRKLFIKCFSHGETVSAEEWFDALCEYEKNLKTCKRNPNHEYRKGLYRCPYCALNS